LIKNLSFDRQENRKRKVERFVVAKTNGFKQIVSRPSSNLILSLLFKLFTTP